MNNFLLEIYSEEIPSSAQKLGEKELVENFNLLFDKEGISYSSLKTFSTPRRITIVVEKVLKSSSSNINEIRGPSTSADEKAIEGFLRSQNINDRKLLKRKTINNKEYFFNISKTKEQKLNKIFEKKIPTILASIKWRKSMRWSNHSEKWSRPIKSILGLFNGKKLNFEFAGIKSDVYTFGNYQYSNKKFKCTSFKLYQEILKQNFVIIGGPERKIKIQKDLETFSRKKSYKCNFSETLIDRISNSVEFTNVFFGDFDKKYFDLPDFILETIITEKQDNFCFKDNKGNLTNAFAFVSNKEKSKKKNMLEGNKNVLRARFADANFFIEEDLKIKPSERIKKLSTMVFYDNLGTLYDRAQRIVKLSEIVSKKLNLNIDRFKKDLIFSNFDLTTEIVKEYPMLQGQAGGYYAKKFGFPDEVVNAFNNQYKISLKTKSADLSVVLSLAQKIDGIFGFISTKKKISGSGDPFGIRRTTISIIKILIENNLELDLYQLMQECQEIYKKQKLNFLKDLSFIQSFFNKRIEIFFAEIGYNQEIIRSNLKRDSFNPRVILEKIKSLKKFLDSESGKLFLKAFKRLSSIIDDVEDKGNIDESLFQKKEERNLYESIKVIKGKNKTYYKEIYEDIYSQISIQIDHFLDNVMVNDEDINVRKNRKLLLLECKKVLNLNFNFSVLGN